MIDVVKYVVAAALAIFVAATGGPKVEKAFHSIRNACPICGGIDERAIHTSSGEMQ